MRWCAAALLVLSLAGCLAPAAQEPQAAPVDTRAEATALTLPACVTQHAPFTVSVTLHDASGKGGATDVAVVAQQYGRIAVASVVLAPGETRALALPAVVDTAGGWDVYVTQPTSSAPQQRLLVVEPGRGC